MKQVQSTRQVQALTQRLSPQMQQVIGLLSLGGADLLSAIAEKAADNPALDMRLPTTTGPAQVHYDPEGAITLGDHIRAQLPYLLPRSQDAPIAEALIAALNVYGFVEIPLVQIAYECRTSTDRVETVLSALQCGEPTGIFARSLSDCLALQLRERGEMSTEMTALLDGLELIAEGRLTELAAHCSVDQPALARMIAQIRALNPRPAAGFQSTPVQVRVPDLVVQSGDDGLSVMLNPDAQPKLRLLAPDGPYAQAQHREARQLQRALAMRNRTVLALGRFLIAHQQGFLTQAATCLRPLTRRMAAQALGVHSSTIGRIVAHCALQTPDGIVPMCALFSGVAGPAHSASDISADAVQTAIARRIAAEDPTRPVSDTSLAAWLAAQGMPLSRRTVGNHRARAGFPDKASRRRLADMRSWPK